MRVFGFLLLILAIGIPVWAQPVCARGYITLRKGPGLQHPVSWRVARYMPFLRVERKGVWVKVQDLEGEVHWARSSDLTTKDRCIVVKTNLAALRQKPNTTAPLAEFKNVDRYTPFKRLESSADWLRVEDEAGRQAWVHESNVWKPVTINAFSF